MAKAGLQGASVEPLLRIASETTGWSLCIGAGTSVPLFPSWFDLVRDLVRPTDDRLISQFSLDAWIQASRDRLQLDDDAFAELLSDKLYARLRGLIGTDWPVAAAVLGARNPGSVSDDVWTQFTPIRGAHFSRTSADALARVVAKTLGTAVSPSTILSFNAEMAMYALINATVHASGGRTQPMDLVTEQTSSRRPDRIPYAFCHGLLPVPNNPDSAKLSGGAKKLVFSEGQYLQLAGQAFSWSASLFCEAAATTRLVFVGVSLSDPNMRKWLSWVHSIRTDEIARHHDGVDASTPHLWIQQRNPSWDAAWTEAAVAHLGVRLVWVDRWNELELVMQRLLGLS